MEHYDTVFLVGTGAEEGAWLPITRAINQARGENAVEDGNADQANLWMAKLIALRRATHAVDLRTGQNTREWVEGVHERLRKGICAELARAEDDDSLRLRQRLLDRFPDGEWGHSRLVMTTNWDTLLERRLGVRVQYIHGSRQDWRSLYLPSDYAFDPAHADETQQRMFLDQDSTIQPLWRTQQFVIWGLSLDPLDGELALALETGLRSSPALQRILIVNLEGEEKKLRNRVRLLAPPDLRNRIQFEAVDAR